MEFPFAVFGAISALSLTAGFLFFVLGLVDESRRNCHYKGLKSQILAAAIDIAEAYEDHEVMSIGSVRRILNELYARHSPNIEHIKDWDRALLSPPPGDE